jgi:1-acyl-sn-glycerol-3-phosphate acyltransferase
MKSYSLAYYFIYRFGLRILLTLYLRFRFRFKLRLPVGAKIFVGNHPMVWDVFSPVVMFRHDIIHTLIEDQIWSFPLARLILSLTNQVKMIRGVESVRSLRESLAWLKRGHSLAVAPEGERTSVAEARAATRGFVWLAAKARVPLIPLGVWIAEDDLYLKKVRYHYQGRSYTVDSFFPRFRARYFLLVGEQIRLDRYYDGKHLSPQERQEIADEVLNIIYQLKEEAKQICAKSR